MAKKKAGGATRQHPTRPGKRLGLKLFGGQKVKIGGIIVRQRGTRIRAGKGVKMGRDFTLFATKPGQIAFKVKHGRTYVCVS